MTAEPALDELLSGSREFWRARKRISGLIRETPLVYAEGLSKTLKASVFLKYEFILPTGSFKLRGAANKILSLSPDQQKLGIATFSTGNHGLAVAYVAKELGIPAAIFISERVPRSKADNLERMGVNLFTCGESQDDAEEYCCQKAAEEGWTVIKPFDDPLVIAGQGTIGLELLERLPELDCVMVPLSGGGLIAGIALALKSNLPDLRIIGVSMEKSAVMYQSLREGKPVVLKEHNTLADSLLGGIGLDNRFTFPIVQRYVDSTVLVSEEAIARSMAYLFKEQRLAVEGAAATTVAAASVFNLIKAGSSVALIISGNNIDAVSFIKAVSKHL